jgi:riboflavin synthase
VFTGLVQDLGRVVESAPHDGGARLRIAARCAAELAEGDSVLVNGVCLTATAPGDGEFGADLSAETLSRSSLAALASGDTINLELPLRPADRLGGHIVQGHVDGLGTVSGIRAAGLSREVRIDAPPELLRYVVEKGSIAVDGVSLTVTTVDEGAFEVSLVPETLERTNLTDAILGRRVNLEVDVIAKYVEKLVKRT